MQHIELVARIGDDGQIHTERYDHPMRLTFGVDRDLVYIHRDRTTPRHRRLVTA